MHPTTLQSPAAQPQQHTQGPWLVLDPGPKRPLQIAQAGTFGSVAEMGGWAPPAEELANAKLIAAAPRMLEVLHQADAWVSAAEHGDNCFVSDHYEGDPGSRCNCGLESLQEAITEAITAATGEAA